MIINLLLVGIICYDVEFCGNVYLRSWKDLITTCDIEQYENTCMPCLVLHSMIYCIPSRIVMTEGCFFNCLLLFSRYTYWRAWKIVCTSSW